MSLSQNIVRQAMIIFQSPKHKDKNTHFLEYMTIGIFIWLLFCHTFVYRSTLNILPVPIDSFGAHLLAGGPSLLFRVAVGGSASAPLSKLSY